MILSDKDVLERVRKEAIIVDPFIKKNLQPSSLDLELSEEIRIFNNWEQGEIDVRQKKEPSRVVKISKDGFVIHPNEFVLGCTREKFKLPNDIAGKLEGRSSLGRLGLIVHATAGYVDPGFEGWLTLEISNLSKLPIRIYSGMRIAQICFYQMSSEVLAPYGSKKLGSKYQGQKGPTASKHWKDFDKD